MPAAEAQHATKIPQVTSEDLAAFHHAHFSEDAATHFAGTFLKPEGAASATPEPDDWDTEDDGLGYYDDGVKRTLTDEQIEIFRHSELQQLRKAEEKKAARAASPSIDEGELPEGEAVKDRSAQGPKRKKRKTNKPPREPKPDLRKRTWDVVEAGLDTLDYD